MCMSPFYIPVKAGYWLLQLLAGVARNRLGALKTVSVAHP